MADNKIKDGPFDRFFKAHFCIFLVLFGAMCFAI